MNENVIHIEICKSHWKKGAWNLRIGDLRGSTEISNSSKAEMLKTIKDEIDEFEKKETDMH